MSQKWNLGDIRPSGTAKDRPKAMAPRRPQIDIAQRPRPDIEQSAAQDFEVGTIDVIDGNADKRRRIVISTIVGLAIIVLGIFVNVQLGGAEIQAFPKFKDVNVQATIVAYREPSNDRDLSYELLTLEAEGERQVKASGQETVSERATGKILIYNAHSATPQRLIKNTRFESPDGLIYRISESVEVPGTTKGQNGEVVPGVVTATVFADGTGEQYNIGPTRFTLPGLRGSDQYSTISGESTTAFTGGFDGSRYLISDSELSTAKQGLHLELRNSLLKKLETERPAGFVVYDNAVAITFTSLPATSYGAEMATIKERAILNVPLFKDSAFAKFLAEQTIPSYENESVIISDPTSLTFSYSGATTSVSDISLLQSLEFKLQGVAQIVWAFDAEKLKADLAGLPKESLDSYLRDQGALERARSSIKPFWKSTFPDNVANINVKTIVGTGE